jgi:hypothetical protein
LTGSSSSLFSYYNTIRSDDFTSRQPLLTRQRSSCSSSLALYLPADLFHVHFSLFYPPLLPFPLWIVLLDLTQRAADRL